jgi:hypothetical protein
MSLTEEFGNVTGEGKVLGFHPKADCDCIVGPYYACKNAAI